MCRCSLVDISNTLEAKNMAIAYDAASQRMEVTETVKEVQQLLDESAEEEVLKSFSHLICEYNLPVVAA